MILYWLEVSFPWTVISKLDDIIMHFLKSLMCEASKFDYPFADILRTDDEYIYTLVASNMIILG